MAAVTAGPSEASGTMPLPSTAINGTSILAAKEAIWPGTTKAG